MVAALALLGCSKGAESESPGLEFAKDATSERTCEAFQEDPHGRGDIVLGVEGTLTVIYCSNATTGFQWQESPGLSDPAVLQQVGHEFQAPTGGAAGAAGKEEWTFKTLEEGVSTIHFEYSRS